MNSNDNILILGASSSIGRQFMETVSTHGCKVIAHYNSRRIEKVNNIVPVQADLKDGQQVRNLVEFLKQNDLLPNKIVHIASDRLMLKHFKKQSWKDFQNLFDVQLKSFMLIAKELFPLMSRLENAKVVTILSSVVLSKPPMGMANYVTTKYALLGLTRALASEYPKISINSISPSMMETSFLAQVPEKIIELESNSNPKKRNATVSDVIPSLLFLLDDRNEFMTGANIPVTGGALFS